MNVYTYTEARHNLSTVLDKAYTDGEVKIKRRDGRVFVLKPEESKKSPLDIKGIDLDLSSENIVQSIHESRQKYDAFSRLLSGVPDKNIWNELDSKSAQGKKSSRRHLKK